MVLVMSRVLSVCSLMFLLINAHCNLAVADGEGKGKDIVIAEAPTARKLGKHNDLHSKSSPSPSPSVEESGGAAQEEVMKSHHHHHRSLDRSVAGGGVILGGLAAVFLVAVFCYIRATRRKTLVPGSPTDACAGGGGGGKNIAEPGPATAP